MVKRRFNVVIEKDEDGYYVAGVPSLPGCHSQAKSLDELMARIKEAILLYLEIERENLDLTTEFVEVHVFEA